MYEQDVVFFSLIAVGIFVFVFSILMIIKSKKKPKKEKLTKFDTHFPIENPSPIESQTVPKGYATSSTYSDYKKIIPATDIVLIMAAISGIVMFAFAYFVPQAGILAGLLGGFLFLPIGVFFGFIFSTSFRIKLLRRLMRKNYGFVKFLYGNKVIKTIMANLDRDTIEFEDGIYFVNQGNIKSEKSEKIAGQVISPPTIHYEEGIPAIYYDVNDAIPIDFKENPETAFVRLPKQISATLNKEIAVEKAKVMSAFKSRANILLIIILIVCVVNIYFCYSFYSQIGDIDGAIAEIRNLATVVSQLIHQQPQPGGQPVVIP